MHKTRNLEDCIKYRRLQGVAQRILKNASQEHWQTYCSSLTLATKLGSIWKMSKRMNGCNVFSSMPNLQKDGQTFQTNKDKADVLAQTYASVSSDDNYSDQFRLNKTEKEISWQSTVPELNDNNKINEPIKEHEQTRAINNSKKTLHQGWME